MQADVVSLLGGDDILNASSGTDTLDGGAGNDTLDYSDSTGINHVSVVLNGSSAVTVDVDGGDNDSIANIENIVGSLGDDSLGGDSLDNQFTGLDGADYFAASDGADVYFGGEGSDTIDYSGFASASSITLTLQNDDLASISIVGSEADSVYSIENVVGTAGSDQITGDSSSNELDGRGGDDTLDGGDGDDTILGGAGADLIIGSAGADTSIGGSGVDTIDYSAQAAGQSINVTLNGATEAIVSISGADDQTVSEIENVVGSSGDDQITGDAQQNRLQGLDGSDLLGASGGSDILDGGAGRIRLIILRPVFSASVWRWMRVTRPRCRSVVAITMR